MKKLLLLSIIICNAFIAVSQTQNWLWAKGSSGGTNDDKGQSITTDASGNILATGFFRSNTTTFGSTTLTNTNTNNTADIFVIKYDALGNLQWANNFGGTGDDIGNSIISDGSGNIYITGSFSSSTISFGSTTLSNPNSLPAMFVVKCNSAGTVVWAINPEKFGTFSGIVGNCISVDVNSNVFVIGYFTANTFTGNYIRFAGVGDFSGNDGSREYFIVKYNVSGNAVWASKSGGSYDEEGYGISTDLTGNVFATGYFKSDSIVLGSITLNNAGGTSCSIAGCKDVFLVKYDASGNVLWAKGAGGNNNDDLGWSCKTDINGNVYVTGMVQSYTITFGTVTLTNPGNYFIVKYDASGNAIWAKCTANGNSNNAIGKGICTDVNSNVYVTGYFISPTVQFGSVTLTNAGGSNNTYDVFLIKYDSIGNVIWAKNTGYVNHDWGYGTAIDTSGSVLITGFFQSVMITFGNTTLPNANSGTADIFIAKLCQLTSPTVNASGATTFCQGDSVTLTSSFANSYLWSNGATTQSINVSTSGNYSVTVTNINGCSASSSTTNVTVNPLPTATISASGSTTFCQGNNVTLTSSSGSSYLWSTSATTQSITVNQSGSYSVVVTNSCGSDTSSALIITVNPLPTATITPSGATTFCQGNSVTLTASSANSYLWSNSATTQSINVSTSGNYSVTVTNANGCSSTSSATTVTVNSLPTVTLSLTPDTVCINTGAYALTGGSPSGGTYSGVGVSGGNFNPNTAGAGLHNIIYTYTDGNNCTNSDTTQIFVDLCTSVQNLSANQLISISPNPTNGIFTIQSSEKNYGIEVTNVFGEKIYQSSIQQFGNSTIDISSQPNGIYFLRVSVPSEQVKTEKGIATKKLIISR